jgi:eukaryotic-like serine/threonine-protein kinase
MTLNPGQSLQNGKYTIERELGRGRFGITYLAKRSDGERWVIKILNPDVLAALNADERDRLETKFWNEAVSLAQCVGIPHIVQAERPFKEGAVVCLPMEYVGGESLADRPQKILLETTTLEYVRQIGEALEVVYKKTGLVHCDIRPANILLRLRDSRVDAVLIDFGLALSFDAELTRTRTQERSDGFSPIELYARGQPVGPYTDVYSLAATLYELLTGEVPVSAGDQKLTGAKLSSPQVWNSAISAQTTKAILAGMKLMPDERPQSVKDWLKLLAVENPVLTTTLGSNVNWTKWQTYWGAAGVLVALVGVLVALFVGIPAWLVLKTPEKTPFPTASPK